MCVDVCSMGYSNANLKWSEPGSGSSFLDLSFIESTQLAGAIRIGFKFELPTGK